MSDQAWVTAGFVGMLTTNSFMKREFGNSLIEQFFPGIDLTHVIDTSGAYIPGHGTPTVILLGRNQSPQSPTVRAILGIKGEPSTPEDPANGLVWQSILAAFYGQDRAIDGFDKILEWCHETDSGDQIGQLYQLQCEDARKGRALVQTPPFARVLLQRETLGRSLQTFGWRETSFCDPSCGTGHLLVDAARFLYNFIREAEPKMGRREAAQEALDRVTGVDLDPMCAQIAKYRLVQAIWNETGWPGTTYLTNVYVGDSLLHHKPVAGFDFNDELLEVLVPGRFTAVASNPPYIVAPDAKIGNAYRSKYVSAKGQYSLACPFTELCFGIARRSGKQPPPPVGDAPLYFPTQKELFG